MMAPRTVTVTGSFHNQHLRPAQGIVQFVPTRMWVVREGIHWACLAPKTLLASDGSFVVQVTPTDTDAIGWSYYVLTPAGAYKVEVPYSEAGHTLRELIHAHRAGTRP